jgi:hypothetical protein
MESLARVYGWRDEAPSELSVNLRLQSFDSTMTASFKFGAASLERTLKKPPNSTIAIAVRGNEQTMCPPAAAAHPIQVPVEGKRGYALSTQT